MTTARYAVVHSSDMMNNEFIRVQQADFDIASATQRVESKTNEVGGIVTFLGSVRSISKGRKVERLEYSIYENMAEKKLSDIRQAALDTEGIHEVLLYHRHGELDVGEHTILIIVGGEHREEAYQISRDILERVKNEVPIWKKEITEEQIVLLHFWN